ncbi:MAG: DUF2961 domain-containing protein [Bacteroidales bacterium]|nr:DUF2961 domain-containing protein [Bacteroidales bacterium]MDT8431798.1 glycoside hydrolase family 172 protein [Bacteroidales bacterium]
MKKLLFFAGIMLLAVSCGKQKITFESLLLEMTDREEIARYPDPEYSLRQFSSYDRATVSPGDSTWFANWDRSMFIRTDTINGRREYVMMDAEGPGAVVRFWMTFAGENSGKGTMRIYFDNEAEPSIEGTAFEVLSGGLLAGAPLSTSVSDSTEYAHRGHNLYLPLPYAKHCKITYESDNILDPGAKTGGEAAYYNINYRTYPSRTEVVTFSEEELGRSANTLAAVQNTLAERERGLDGLDLERTDIEITIPADDGLVMDMTGSKALRSIRLKLEADNLEQALRTTILELTFDGQRTVWCPVGDFFGTGYQLRYSNTWYSKVEHDGTMEAYWVMPFRENCIIRLLNMGNKEVSVTGGEITTSPWKWDDRSMYFGASWHQYTALHTGQAKTMEGGGGMFDINFVELNGEGVYVGDAITVFNTVYAWWGEGDEKIFVDGEDFPSSIGTGTEDYYGYAWCRPEKFANHPFIAQPDGSGNFWPGYTVNIRYRGLDAIPFRDSLRVDMEMWHWTHAIINYAPVTFWYVLPGGESQVAPDVAGAKAKVALERADIITPVARPSGIEAENMKLESMTGGRFEYQGFLSHLWSGNEQAFWLEGHVGDRLTLSFISEEAGIFRIGAGCTTAPDYGRFRIRFNDNPVPGTFNLYSEEISTLHINLGMQPVRKGKNELTFELAGYSPDGTRGFLGLDYLKIE